MKILVEGEIKKSIKRCNPSKIAVAYIGSDWNMFVQNIDHLSTVIVSPTIGSNPRAIMDIARKIGWENVHFLDELHAKNIYWRKISRCRKRQSYK